MQRSQYAYAPCRGRGSIGMTTRRLQRNGRRACSLVERSHCYIICLPPPRSSASSEVRAGLTWKFCVLRRESSCVQKWLYHHEHVWKCLKPVQRLREVGILRLPASTSSTKLLLLLLNFILIHQMHRHCCLLDVEGSPHLSLNDEYLEESTRMEEENKRRYRGVCIS